MQGIHSQTKYRIVITNILSKLVALGSHLVSFLFRWGTNAALELRLMVLLVCVVYLYI